MKNIITKKSSDTGYSFVPGYGNIKKNSKIICLLGELDELNVFLGFITECISIRTNNYVFLKRICRIQKELFYIVSKLLLKKDMICCIDSYILKLEKEITIMSKSLPELNSFVLPHNNKIGIRFHLARVICRKVERTLFGIKNCNFIILGKYLNRLSYWLFIAARKVSKLSNSKINELKINC